MRVMPESELIRRVSDNTGIDELVVNRLLHGLVHTTHEALDRGDAVLIPRLGTLFKTPLNRPNGVTASFIASVELEDVLN